SDNSAVNFNACRQVFCFSNICSKVTKSTHPSFPKVASNRRYPAVFCAHPVSSIPNNSEFQKTGKNRSCSDCSCPDLKHHYCLDHLPSPPLKHPFLFWFMRICEGNFLSPSSE